MASKHRRAQVNAPAAKNTRSNGPAVAPVPPPACGGWASAGAVPAATEPAPGERQGSRGLESVQAAVEDFIEEKLGACRAPGTKRVYQKAWDRWAAWCLFRGAPVYLQ